MTTTQSSLADLLSSPALGAILLGLLPVLFYFLSSHIKSLSSSKSSIPIPSPSEIVSVRIYPIKSCRGIEVSSAKLLKTGLDLDRNWMFIDIAEKRFQTIRESSQMTLINTAIDWAKDELTITLGGDKPAKLTIPAHPTPAWLDANTTLMQGATIWSDKVDAYVYDASLTAPFSAFLGKDVRLVCKGPTPRVLRGNGAPDALGRTEATKFADLAPVLVANAKSLEELNERLKGQGEGEITVERFRPNIIVKGDVAWGEDVWKTVQIGGGGDESGAKTVGTGGGAKGTVMDVVARCTRCQVPNVDPDTAVKNKRQPWDTLMSYRRIDPGMKYKPCFGMLCCPRDEGVVRVGGTLRITEVTGEHAYIKGM